MPGAEPGCWYAVQQRDGRPRVAVQHKDSEQAHLCLAYPTVPVTHPDRFVVDLISTVLGEGMSSRLFLELREERALVYDVHSYPSEFRDAGSITIYAGCDPQNARTTVEIALHEVANLMRTLTPPEVQKAQQMARGRIQLRMEDTRSVAGWMGSQEMLLGEILTVDEAAARIDAVTMDDMLRVTGELLRPERATIAAVGPFNSAGLFSGLV